MAPLDPGAAIHWAKRPAYTVSLLSELSNLPRPEAHLALTSQLNELTKAQKTQRLQLIKGVTSRLFIATGAGQGEALEKRKKSHETSVGRRLQQ